MKNNKQIIDLTFDVCVLMSGSGIGNPKYLILCNELMKKSLVKKSLHLALDKRGRIRHQYEKKLKEGVFGHSWLCQMADKDKIKLIPWQNIDRGTKTALQEVHFDPEDFKYVETAAATECKTIASHDPDYSKKVCKVLKKLKVAVKNPQECVSCFCD